MKVVTRISGLFLLACSMCLAETIGEVSWDRAKPTSGEVVPAGQDAPFAQLKVANDKPAPAAMRILVIEKPGIAESSYAIAGRVRYEGVEGKGYLEMWTEFPSGDRYFSRTLGSGPMSPIEGSSRWRDFVLPFTISRSQGKPERLILNVVLTGRGTVYLGPLRLVQPAPGGDRSATPGQWWGNRSGGVIGSVGGLLGGLAGVLGALTGWLAPRGRARGFIMAAWRLFLAIGLATLIAGVVAVSQRQPYLVFYPLLLVGFILTVVTAALMPTIRKRYQEFELRRMGAQDARGCLE